jgi:hypothetical protein
MVTKAKSADNKEYAEAVREGKQIVKRNGSDRWRLGELAHLVETNYREHSLAKYAEEIGYDFSDCTLDRLRDTYRAWKDVIGAPGRQSYSVLRELATLPKVDPKLAAKIVAGEPITKSEARKIKEEHKPAGENEEEEENKKKNNKKKKKANGSDAEDDSNEHRSWYRRVVDLARDLRSQIPTSPMTPGPAGSGSRNEDRAR